MSKCLVTKLSGVVSNNKLAKIGELAFPLDENITSIEYASNVDATLRIADGTFEDGSDSKFVNLSEWKTILKFSRKKDAILFVPNKKDIIIFSVNTDNKSYNSPLSFNDLHYMTSLKYFSSVGNKSLTGDISLLPDSIISIQLSDTSISGNIGTMTARPQDLRIDNTSVKGDITSVLNKTYYFSAKGITGLYGDLSKVSTEGISNSSVPFYSTIGNYSWSDRPTSAMIVALEGPNLGNYVDKMLQDQANCKVPEKLSEAQQSWYKAISVKGTRTSASDAAVTTLQQKGYTVSITPA